MGDNVRKNKTSGIGAYSSYRSLQSDGGAQDDLPFCWFRTE